MRRLATSTALLVFLVAGCSGSDDDDGAAAATTGTPAPTTAPAVATTIDATTTTTTSTAPVTTTTTTTTTTTAADPATTLPPAAPAAAPSIRSIIDNRTFMNLAHAGGDQSAPHSTRYAFDQAVAAGANALELDVQLTADGVLIVQHDDTVDKTTEQTGPVADLTLEQIQALDNAFWFSPECWPCQNRPLEEYIYRGVRTGDVPPPPGAEADDFRVPTFREIALAFPDLPLDIEIKGELPAAGAVAEQLAAEIEELDRTTSVVVVSFDDAVVDMFREIAPEVAVSPGLGRLTDWFLGVADLEPHFEVLQLPPFQGEIEVITPEVVERIHAEGRVVWVWADDASSQENADFYGALLADGVDGIIAGRPEALAFALAG